MRAQRFTVMRGTTAECLAHLGGQLNTAKRNSVEPMARRIGVNVITVSRWLRGKQPPKGMPLVKLRYYLQSLGFAVTELEHLNDEAFSLGQLFADGVMTVQTVMDALGYQDEKSVLQILHGEQHPIGGRHQALKEFVQQHATALGQPARRPQPATPGIPSIPAPAAVQVNGSVPLDRKAVITAAAALAAALRPLTALLVGDQFTAEDREELRKTVPGDGIFHLSRDVNQLCSERARIQFAGAEWHKTGHTEREGIK